MRLRLFVAVSAAAVLAAPRPAVAYVPYLTSMGVKFHWPGSCVPIRVYVDDLTEMTPDQVMRAATGAAAAWSAAANPCSSINLVVERAAGAGPATKYDSVNTVTFRRTSWPYGAGSESLASVYVNTKTGEIRDVDVEINASDYHWTDLEADPGATTKTDLQSVLAYNFGHLLGFDASCWFGAGGAMATVDEKGSPVPDCPNAPADVRATTMYPATFPGDTSKRTLEAEDKRAVCETYPSATPGGNADAAPPTFAACASASAGDGGPDARTDASPGPTTDAAAPGDAGGSKPSQPSSGGCGCGLGDRRGGPWGLGLTLLILLARPRARRTMAPTHAHRRLRL